MQTPLDKGLGTAPLNLLKPGFHSATQFNYLMARRRLNRCFTGYRKQTFHSHWLPGVRYSDPIHKK